MPVIQDFILGSRFYVPGEPVVVTILTGLEVKAAKELLAAEAVVVVLVPTPGQAAAGEREETV
jgi:hypothetical protein